MTRWSTVRLSDVAKIDRAGIEPRSIQTGCLYVGLENIESGGQLTDVRSVSTGYLTSTKFRFGPDHLLYGKLRPYLAKIALPDFSGVCSTDILPVLPSKALDRQYLAYFLRQPQMVAYASSRAEGINLPRLSPKALAEFEIPLPPLAEQKRIASVLNYADTIRRKRRETIVKLGILLNSFFLETSYVANLRISIGTALEQDVLIIHKDGNHGSLYPRAQDFGSEGIPFLSAKSISLRGDIDDALTERLSEPKALKLKHGWVVSGDVLLAHNATVGKVGLYKGQYERAIVGTSLTVFRPNRDKLLPGFLFAALRGSDFQKQLKKNMGQTTRNQVPITAQRALTLPLPDIDTQHAFARKMAAVEYAKECADAHLLKIDALIASLRYRAFRGEMMYKEAQSALAVAG